MLKHFVVAAYLSPLAEKMKPNNCNCEMASDYYPGQSIKGLKGIYEKLNLIETNFKEWVSRFECRECGQIWEERYVYKGHGEVPEVRKISKNTNDS